MNYSQDIEKSELLGALENHRRLLRSTARDLSDEQASARLTASELSIGGIIKHVTHVERTWVHFIVNGNGGSAVEARGESALTTVFPETIASVLEDYAAAARETVAAVEAAVDLNARWSLPVTPRGPESGTWSVRRVLVHILAETAQHAGHADIIRETIDGAKTMG